VTHTGRCEQLVNYSNQLHGPCNIFGLVRKARSRGFP
jgi:hypothetical protein